MFYTEHFTLHLLTCFSHVNALALCSFYVRIDPVHFMVEPWKRVCYAFWGFTR